MACPPVIVAAQQSLNKNMVLSIDMLGITHICMGMFARFSWIFYGLVNNPTAETSDNFPMGELIGDSKMVRN